MTMPSDVLSSLYLGEHQAETFAAAHDSTRPIRGKSGISTSPSTQRTPQFSGTDSDDTCRHGHRRFVPSVVFRVSLEQWRLSKRWSIGFLERVLVRVLPHAEMLKFLVVGGIAFIVTTVLFFSIKWTVLPQHPVTANILAVLIATVLSHVPQPRMVVCSARWSTAPSRGRSVLHRRGYRFGHQPGTSLDLQVRVPPASTRGVGVDGELRGLHQRIDHRDPAGDGLPLVGHASVCARWASSGSSNAFSSERSSNDHAPI